MNSYLNIADSILRAVKRPLTAKEILKIAYKSKIVPKNLYGKTQHKTLQARLSEDILAYRDKSSFFRTAPGVFFLREFLLDGSIPSKYRVPIVARRRQRELPVKGALSISNSALNIIDKSHKSTIKDCLNTITRSRETTYISTSKFRKPDEILLWSFVILTRNSYILTYRQGRYRENRDSFSGRRTIGFYAPVSETDNDLFDRGNLGIINSSLTSLCMELDFDPRIVWSDLLPSAHLENLLVARSPEEVTDVLALVRFECPEWLEPLTRRLSLNDIRWQDLRSNVNHIEDFDPWSQLILSYLKNNNPVRNDIKCKF